MFHDTRFMLLQVAMMLPGMRRASDREITAEEMERRSAQQHEQDKLRTGGGFLDGVTFGSNCRCNCKCRGGRS